MQQLAAKNTDIAALPISVADAASGSFTQTIENGQQHQPLPGGQSEPAGDFKAIYAQVSEDTSVQTSAPKADENAPSANAEPKNSKQLAVNPAPKYTSDGNSENEPAPTAGDEADIVASPDLARDDNDDVIAESGSVTQGVAKESNEPKPPRDGRIELPPEYSIQPIEPAPLTDDGVITQQTPVVSEEDGSSAIVSLVESVMQLDDNLTALVSHKDNDKATNVTVGKMPEEPQSILPIIPEQLSDAVEESNQALELALGAELVSDPAAEKTIIASPVDTNPAEELLPVDGKPLPERMTIQPIAPPEHAFSVTPESAESALLSAENEISSDLGKASTEISEDQVALEVSENPQSLLELVQAVKQEGLNEAKMPESSGVNTIELLSSLETKINDVISGASDSISSEELAALESSLTSEESMLLGLIQDTLKTTQANTSKEAAVAQPSTPSVSIVENGNGATESTLLNTAEDMFSVLADMSPETAQKATTAFADRIVALMPNANAQQQQAVKANVVNALNEFQQQVAQGREPGIDVSSMIADAMSEANMPPSTTQSVLAQLDTQVGAFMQLVNQSQSAAYQTAQHGMSQAESLISENNQVRSESSRAQQQFDGMDKPVNVLKPEGQTQLSEKIRWMVNARNAMAEIRLDPPELGSMQVRVNVSGEAATVNFVVQSQHAKDALADTMPKLREMLQEQGISLGESTVQQDSRSQSNGDEGQQFAGGSTGNGDIEQDEDTRVIEQSINLNTEGGIDFYA
ncbi:flagellar hook-length control protein FliK [Alteromonas sp. KUL49]|uniref:flagellar hook-length control protein FliK n=1 Tax=Alteromonas sp. KUL49 TaxID=2480798 RepID=UPI00102EFE0D|nr:flagellar hook-length control protein FliK [Alteromonas sp. KUL49]TAP39718.1 flagellar hook-length control protein FliK [Alteromonas sp. KUL49]GEA11708.1 flagellar hook-length control protein FliK [Alteromonas sp. KUL49]